jgi:hypothetical protein
MYRVIARAIAVLPVCAAAILSATISAVADDRDTCGDWLKGDETAAVCVRLIKRNPKDVDAYFKRGMYYAIGGDARRSSSIRI